MAHVSHSDRAITAGGAAVVRPHISVAARLLIVDIRNAMRPRVIGQHADAVRQSLVRGQVEAFIGRCSAVQRLRDVGEILSL